MQHRSIENLEKQIDLHLNRSRENLRAAKHLLDNDFYRIAISRIYYAFLDSANALLLTKDLKPKSHGGTIMLFGLHFIKTKIIDSKYGRWFSRIEKYRLEADYEIQKDFSREEVIGALSDSEEFYKVAVNLKDTLLKDLQEEK